MMLMIIYLLLGYWAVGRTIWANKVMIGTSGAIFLNRVFYALFLGWILIPWAILKLIFHH